MTRLQDLQNAAAEHGYSVFTHSPGDGKTRYAFFLNATPDQTYFGPRNPEFRAMGLKQAWQAVRVMNFRRIGML